MSEMEPSGNAMVQWEYQVIRLNIEPPVAENPQHKNTGQADDKNKTMFSEAYLKEEFPRFYDSKDQAKQAQAQQQADPAFQLQDFLNSQGQQG